ncbi:MAG: phosphoribosylformylglycinamidine cyclo-ligase [Actinomycetota bacterium]
MGDGYREAGVDAEAAAKAAELIKDIAAGATRPEVVEGIGGFAGLFRLGGGRVLAAATDGVGTKTEIARLVGRYDTIGIDLVAMCADDVACSGAQPLLFLDYLAVGRLDPERAAEIVKGVAEGCRLAQCALLGGETAEHAGVMDDDRFDLAGFCVGSVDEAFLLGSRRVQEGDSLVGLVSSGLHSNGYSLVRKALIETGRYQLAQTPFGLERPLGEELLMPTAIYAPLVTELAQRGSVHSAAHITGGGFQENIPRALPEGLGAQIDTSSWQPQPIFDLMQQATGISREEMFATFNMGIGMVLVVPQERGQEVVHASSEAGHHAVVVGSVVPGWGVRLD